MAEGSIFGLMADPRAVRAKKLTYVGIGIGLVLGVVAKFLPPNYQWFLMGVIVGVFVALGLLFSNLFWNHQ